jgi:hypothetical protein
MRSKVTMIPDNINQKKTRKTTGKKTGCTLEVKIYVPDERKRHRDCHVMDCCPTQIYVHVPYRQSIIVMNACLEWNDTYYLVRTVVGMQIYVGIVHM